jgi:hypothetical protein
LGAKVFHVWARLGFSSSFDLSLIQANSAIVLVLQPRADVDTQGRSALQEGAPAIVGIVSPSIAYSTSSWLYCACGVVPAAIG